MPSSRIILKEVDDLRIIEIRDVTPQDAGLYRITLENDVGRIEATARLDVVAHRPHPIRGLRARSASPKPAPNYRRCLMNSSSRLGGMTRLSCDLRGLPVSSGIQWYKQDIPIDESSGKYRILTSESETILEISGLDVGDKSTYRCVVGGGGDEIVETLIELDVVEPEGNPMCAPPVIQEDFPETKTVPEGSPVKLEVKVGGTKPFDVIWIKDGCILPQCGDFKQTDDGCGNISLRIKDCFVQDGGNYRCEVYNTYGEAFSKCCLTVYGKFL